MKPLPPLRLALLSVVTALVSCLSPTLQAEPTASFAELDRAARAGEPLSVVFLGGSLTWGANASDPQRTSYRALMGRWLQERYPSSPITVHDAAIGGTGSELAAFRLDRDVLARDPDLVFLDFTINDGPAAQDPTRLASYESLLRRLIARGVCVQQVLLTTRDQLAPGFKPDTLHRVVAHRELSAAYGTAVGDALAYIRPLVEAGEADPAALWPFDATHPDDAGYRLCFESVRAGFEEAVAGGRVCRVPAAPVFSAAFDAPERRVLVDADLPAGWSRSTTYRTSMWFDGLSSRWMGDVAACDAADPEGVEPLVVAFEGTFVGLIGEMDERGLPFRVFIDGEPVAPPAGGEPSGLWRARTPKAGRLFFWRVLAEGLEPGRHTLEIHPVLPGGGGGGQLRIESVCSAGRGLGADGEAAAPDAVPGAAP